MNKLQLRALIREEIQQFIKTHKLQKLSIEAVQKTKKVFKCQECGKKLPITARKCSKCGSEDIDILDEDTKQYSSNLKESFKTINKPIDIRKVATKKRRIDPNGSILYLYKNILQVWWTEDVLKRPFKGTAGRETWSFPSEEQAITAFENWGE